MMNNTSPGFEWRAENIFYRSVWSNLLESEWTAEDVRAHQLEDIEQFESISFMYKDYSSSVSAS